jgi:Zn finger protein HypA/HybF involved in hydrogenase expression
MTDSPGVEVTREVSGMLNASVEDGFVACPKCHAEVPLEQLFLEGPGKCPGCARQVNLHITAGETVLSGSNWRNIPEGTEELYR